MDSSITPSMKFDPVMLAHKEPPLISLYMKTHRHSPENQQDLVRFRHLLDQARESLEKSYDKRQAAKLIQQLEALADDPDKTLWRHAKDGLAILAAKDDIQIYQTDYPLNDLVIVAESFHIKPLIRKFQYGADYYLLLLSMDKIRLLRGDFNTLEELSFPEDVKARFDELFDDFDNTSDVSAGTFGGADARFYGYSSKSENVEKDIVKYFRHVDEIVREYFIDVDPLPLILVSLPQHQATFRDLTSITTLLEVGIERAADSMDHEHLFATAIDLVRTIQSEAVKKQLLEFDLAVSRDQGSTDPSTIARALAEKKVASLFVEEGKLLPGRLNIQTGALIYESIESPGIDDLIDDFAQATYLQGGKVLVVDSETLPGKNGVAALFRY